MLPLGQFWSPFLSTLPSLSLFSNHGACFKIFLKGFLMTCMLFLLMVCRMEAQRSLIHVQGKKNCLNLQTFHVEHNTQRTSYLHSICNCVQDIWSESNCNHFSKKECSTGNRVSLKWKHSGLKGLWHLHGCSTPSSPAHTHQDFFVVLFPH